MWSFATFQVFEQWIIAWQVKSGLFINRARFFIEWKKKSRKKGTPLRLKLFEKITPHFRSECTCTLGVWGGSRFSVPFFLCPMIYRVPKSVETMVIVRWLKKGSFFEKSKTRNCNMIICLCELLEVLNRTASKKSKFLPQKLIRVVWN